MRFAASFASARCPPCDSLTAMKRPFSGKVPVATRAGHGERIQESERRRAGSGNCRTPRPAESGRDRRGAPAGGGIDATANETAKRLQRLLLEELHHRVKNTLATVMAITTQSLRTADSLEQGRQAVENRLMALGRAHDLLLQANWSRAKLTDVVRAAVEPFDDREVRRFSIQESPVEVDASAVLPITMSLNELCTNATKYGALSGSAGRIAITSSTDDATKRFKLTWTESGGPLVREPTRRNFGTRLIGRLADQLHGDVRVKYDPAGVVYELEAPMAALRAVEAS